MKGSFCGTPISCLPQLVQEDFNFQQVKVLLDGNWGSSTYPWVSCGGAIFSLLIAFSKLGLPSVDFDK